MHMEGLESRALWATLPYNAGFEQTPDFTSWNVSNGPSTFTPNVAFLGGPIAYSASESVVRGPGAPEGNAYAHLTFSGTVANGATGFGPSLQSSTFVANFGD